MYPTHNIPEPDAELDDLATPIALDYLRNIPTSWDRFDFDSLSHIQRRALKLLVAAGLGERRSRIRLRLFNHPEYALATIAASGEGGLLRAIDPLLGALWGKWKPKFDEWMGGPTAAIFPLHCEWTEPTEWRLTIEGIKGRAKVLRHEHEELIAYVFRSGTYVGRQPYFGDGELVRMKWKSESHPGPSVPPSVHVKNWDEGAKAIVEALKAKHAEEALDAARRPATPRGPVAEDASEDQAACTFASLDVPVPQQFVGPEGPIGPLEGRKNEMAWAVDPRPGRQPRARDLKGLHGTRVWIQQAHPQKVLVYFREPRAMRMAEKERAGLPRGTVYRRIASIRGRWEDGTLRRYLDS